MEKLYSAKEIQRLFGFKATRIRYWDKIGFLTPSVKIGARKYYTSQDLIGFSQWDVERGIKPDHMGFTADVRAGGQESRTSRQNPAGKRGLSKSKSK